MKNRDMALIVIGVAAGAGLATLIARSRKRVGGQGEIDINQIQLFLDDEPWPTTTDDFLALPGRLSAAGFDAPPRGTYCKLSFRATGEAPQRILVKQGGVLSGENHSGGRVVGRYFGDEEIPHTEAFFTSDGEDIYFEFQKYYQELKAWRAHHNTIQDTGDDTDKEYTMRGAQARFVLEWGPRIVRPTPPRPPDDPPRPPAQPHGYLWVRGQAKCKTALGLGSVQTSYAFAWATLTDNPNGPKIAAQELSVSFTYDDFPHGPISKAERNVSEVVASEQIRRVPANCSNINITARGIGPDGVPYSPKSTRITA